MIRIPDGWTRLAGVGSDTFINPDSSVWVRHQLRQAPLRRFVEVAEAALAALPEWSTREVSIRFRTETFEGEHAHVVHAQGTWLSAPAERVIGMVLGDDMYETVDAMGIGVPAFADLALGFVRGVALNLGIRPRRYYYARIPGWMGHPTGLITHFFPPEFPARPTTLVVYPATPTREEPHGIYEALVRTQTGGGMQLVAAPPPREIETEAGLTGWHWSFTCTANAERDAPLVHRELVVLANPPFTYTLQLDQFRDPDEDARRQFLALVNTVEPVPLAGTLAAPVGAQVADMF